jgi:hypothetical protein
MRSVTGKASSGSIRLLRVSQTGDPGGVLTKAFRMDMSRWLGKIWDLSYKTMAVVGCASIYHRSSPTGAELISNLISNLGAKYQGKKGEVVSFW